MNVPSNGMSSRSMLAWRHGLPVLVQGVGSVLAFAVAVIVARRFGIEAQGRFGLLKGWSDAISVVLMFGLPQALLHLSYHGDAPLARLHGFARAYGGRLLLVALPLAAAASLSPWPWLGWAVLAAPGLVLHGLLRSIVLRASGALTYAWVTAGPATLLFGAVLVLALTGVEAFGAALVASAVASALLALAIVRRAGIDSDRPTVPLGVSGLNWQAFVQNACAAAQTALLLSLVAALNASPAAAVGETSVALLFAQAFAMVASFLAPVLYDRVARVGDPVAERAAVRRSMRALALLLPVLALLAGLAVPLVLPRVFLPGQAPTTAACQIMAVAGVLMLANRLGGTLLQARGEFAELTRQAVVRLVFVLLLTTTLVATLHTDAALAAGAALLASEALVSGRLWWLLRRHAPPMQVRP